MSAFETELRTVLSDGSKPLALSHDALDDLLAELDRLRAALEVSEAASKAAVQKAQWQAITNRELNDLRAEAEALRKNAKRYEWLRVNAYVEVRCDSPRIDGWTPEQLDAAIDAERSK